ncbi:MAG: PilZ domain-containing protein [Myxococcota bacterium]
MAGRGSERTKRRTPCTFSIGGRRQNGFVLDLSQTGLFIQTSADPRPGERLDIEVVFGGQVLAMHVEVARRKKVPPQLLTVAQGGIGVRILSAPEGYYAMLAEINGPSRDVRGAQAPAADGSAAAAEPEGPAFRVRVKQVQGTRTRSVRIVAEDEETARSQVLDDLGDEWKILEVTPL